MASGKGATRSNLALDYLLNVGSPTRPGATNALRVALCMTTDPSASSTATGLTVGSGYTAGGELIVFATAASQSTTGDTTAVISWTNSSGSSWVVTGLIVHDAGASHPAEGDMIYFDSSFDVTIPNGASLEIGISGVTATEA